MKNTLLKIWKTILVQSISLSLIIWFVAYASINFPTSSPDGEPQWWLFMQYFNKILLDTWSTTNWMVKDSDKVDWLHANDIITAWWWIHSWVQVFSWVAPITWWDLDLSSIVWNNHALVLIKVKDTETLLTYHEYQFRTKWDTEELGHHTGYDYWTSQANLYLNHFSYLILETDSNWVIQFKSEDSSVPWAKCQITIRWYIK